ncbi:hypothetical protein PR202_ga01937 [Eleusine coracana subsp. coracana]|uniref:Protein FAR1-RELATED SEQUENCE n=1 Tax=Eleusine coracana subsp. coracana TaxID=191504 RepID=A0AAV5BIC0_ELECO|nr:hypothetical protein PR202_ga01250 [Eleusine coracana subsp. coracana]GJM86113.1 hypothetical protein PR202_ga01937 [Eleusine coracana subsp. coracana]
MLESAEAPQDLGGSTAKEATLHDGKEVILVDDNDSGQEDGGKAKVDENAPCIGLRFKTYDDAVNYYKQYAEDSGFSAIIVKSSYLKSGVCRRLVLGCSRSGRGRANACYLSRESTKINCPARISLKLRQDRWLHIDDVKLEHNHPLNQSSASLANCYRKLTDAKNGESASRQKAENLKEHAEFKTIKKALKKVIYGSLKIPEFEADWKKIIEEHGLGGNECLSSLYDHRQLWAPAYLKDKFWAGMSIAQRGESIHSYYDGFVYPKTSLKQFFSKYEMILESKYKKELQADEESSHRTPLTVTKFFMEEQLAKAYTISMFRKFQDELKATMYCDGMPAKVDGPIVTFDVKECSYMEDGKDTESRTYEVYFCKENSSVECECGFFQFTGILCRHALSVLKLQEMFDIPQPYVIDRWKRDYKKLHTKAKPPIEMPLGGIVERSDYLFARCRQLLNLGFVSENRYFVALKLLREAEGSLLNGGLSPGDRQPTLLSFEADAPENGQGLFNPNFSEGVKNSQSANAKRRGRPPKKVTESNADTVTQPNKEQDFLRSSFVTDDTNMIQGTPSASHLEVDVQADPHGFGNQWVYQHPVLQDNPVLRTPTRRAG